MWMFAHGNSLLGVCMQYGLVSTTRILIVTFLAVVGFSQARAQELTLRGASVDLDDFWFQAGGLLKKDRPGVIFGVMKKPDSDRELAYVVLFKQRANAKSQFVTPGNVSAQAKKVPVVTMTGGIEFDDAKIELTLTIEIDRATKAVKSEGLVFAGKTIDLKKGRVFLVDLTKGEPKWQHVEVKRLTKLPELMENADVQQVVTRIFAELPQESDAIREFLK